MTGVNTDNVEKQSSKGFLHWLKNTWLGKLWNWIVSCFRSEKQKTEPQLSSKKEEVMVSKDNESKSSEVEQNRVNESNTIENDKLNSTTESQSASAGEGIVSEDSKSECSEVEQNKVNKSNAIENEELDSVKKTTQLLKNRARKPKTRPPRRKKDMMMPKSSSQSGEEVFESRQRKNSGSSQAPIDHKLEWDHGYDSDLTFLCTETQKTSSQLKREPSSSNIENSDDEATKREQSKSKAQHTSCKTKNRSKQNEQSTKVLKKKEGINRENEKKGEQTLKKSEEKLSGAAKRKQTEDKKKSEKARGMRNRSISNDRSAHNGSSLNSISNSPLISQGEQKPKNIQKSNIGNFAFVHDDGPNQSLSNSNSSLASQSGIDK